jgi:hypothetical protein
MSIWIDYVHHEVTSADPGRNNTSSRRCTIGRLLACHRLTYLVGQGRPVRAKEAQNLLSRQVEGQFINRR